MLRILVKFAHKISRSQVKFAHKIFVCRLKITWADSFWMGIPEGVQVDFKQSYYQLVKLPLRKRSFWGETSRRVEI